MHNAQHNADNIIDLNIDLGDNTVIFGYGTVCHKSVTILYTKLYYVQLLDLNIFIYLCTILFIIFVAFKKRLGYLAGNCLFDFRDFFETLLQICLIAKR